MLKINKETDLQSDIVKTCKALGGFGYKLQDKYIKGKPDLWLKLPSGIAFFTEVKICRNIRFVLTPGFADLQMERLGELEKNNLPAVGTVFAQSPEGYVNFRICSYFELKELELKFKKPKYHVSHFKRAHNFEEIIEAYEKFFFGSTAQQTMTPSAQAMSFFPQQTPGLCVELPAKVVKTSQFKGVYQRRGGWRATLCVGRNAPKHVGDFPDEVTAARAYDKAAREAFGEDAVLNFPEESRAHAD
jgi:hypothetical protein